MNILQLVKLFYNRKKLLRFRKPWLWYNYDLQREIALFWDTPLPKEKIKNTNTEQYEKLISVLSMGGFTGSSAIVDFLAEFDEVTSLTGTYGSGRTKFKKDFFEVLFFSENYGILSLEESIFSKKFFYTDLGALNFSSYVIKKFYSSIYIYDEYFLQRSKEFLFDLIDCHWRWSLGAFNVFLSKEIHYLPTNIVNRIDFINHQNDNIVENIWKNFSLEEYREKAKKYIQDILKHIPSKRYLVAHELGQIGGWDEKIMQDYFGNIKFIYVYRDPRDQYVRGRERFQSYIPKDPIAFSKKFKKTAHSVINTKNSNLLVVRLEDFITNYDKVSNQIMNFLELNENQHTNKFKYFNPEVSGKKIGAYKNYSDQNAIKIIEKELKEYCWNS